MWQRTSKIQRPKKFNRPKRRSQTPPSDNSKELLESANAASGPARNAWLAFLGLLTYLLVTLAGVTHVDLLLNSPVTLPVVNVKIPLFSFFVTAPFLFLLVHLGLLVQHAMLAHKYQHFLAAIAKSEERQREEHPHRKLVHSYVFSQMLAGPRLPWPLHMLMRLMVFVTFSLLPVLVLLYFQVKFLPFHDVATTHAHRFAILLDLALLFIVRPFIAMPYLRPQGKKLGFGNQSWRWEISYASFGIAGLACVGVAAFILLVATVPGACFWTLGKPSQDQDKKCFSLDRTTAQWRAVKVRSGRQTREVFALTKWLFEGEPDETSGSPDSLFSRNLIVTDQDLVEEKDFEKGDKSRDLRGRDLRFAVLDRSDLRYADFFGSNLRGASASSSRLDHADLKAAELQGANLADAQLRGANLKAAELQGANLADAQLQGANLFGAQLQQGADLSQARLQGANLSQAQLQGANLLGARLQGATLIGARLQGATLIGARLQGANLFGARLQGANLYHAQLQGANLERAELQGADLEAAELQGANLRRAKVWQTVPPRLSSLKLAIPLEMDITPISVDEKSLLEELIDGTEREMLQFSLWKRLGHLRSTGQKQFWKGTAEHEFWSNFSSRSRPDPDELSDYLAELACSDGSGGYIIAGIALRVSGTRTYSDHRKLTAAKLVSEGACPAAKHLSQDTQASLKSIAAFERPEAEPSPVE